MKYIPTFCAAVLLLTASLVAPAQVPQPAPATGKLSERLRDELTQQPHKLHKVYALLQDRIDIAVLEAELNARQASVHERGVAVVTQLQDKAAATQPAFLRDLKATPGVRQESLLPLWISNMVFFEAEEQALLRLAAHPSIDYLGLDEAVEFFRAEADHGPSAPAALPVPNGTEPGLRAIGAPALWGMGYTGYGRRLLVVDTGIEADHPALARQYIFHNRPASQAWQGNGLPEDCDGHGTHVAGTSIGLDRLTRDTIGVAFDATWMSGVASLQGVECSNSGNLSSTFALLQWALNPDGNPATTHDQPDVINNSWGSSSDFCGQNYDNVTNALYAAGIAVVFAAGNSGPDPSTVGSPALNNWSLVRNFSVGNLNANNLNLLINSGSSRGPTVCSGSGSLAIKPEVSAPGTNVRSAYPGQGYRSLTGTSMAAPHVAGAILLLKQAFPSLSGEELMLALYFSATDLGVQGEDNDYGMGIINLPAAFDYLVQQGHSPAPPLSAPNDVRLLRLDSPEFNCDNEVELTAIVENASADTIYTLRFEYSMGIANQYAHEWAGTLLPRQRQTIALPAQVLPQGNYDAEVNIALANGLPDARDLDNRMKLRVRVLSEAASTVLWEGGALCEGGSAVLRSSYEGAAQVNWYNAPGQGTLLGTGPVLLLSGLQQSTEVYAEVSPQVRVGRASPPANQMQGNAERGLRFNALHPFRILTVKVYAEEAGGRMIQLLRPDGSLSFKVVQIPSAGEHEVALGFDIEPGQGYVLRLRADGRPFGFNSGGGNSYPYTVPGVMSIVSSTMGTSNYFYFYDWEIQYKERCGRAMAMVSVGEGGTAPTLAIEASADTLDLALGNGNVSFSSSLAEAAEWQWDFGDGATATGQVAQHVYVQPGTYTVSHWVETDEGCTTAALRSVVVLNNSPTSSSALVPHPSDLRVFPNPTGGQLFVVYEGQRPQRCRMVVMDLLGRQVWAQEQYLATGQALEIGLQGLPQGTYILAAELAEGRLVQRIVKW